MTPESDALVVFGVTGDLAYKKIFPALQSLVRRRPAEGADRRRRPDCRCTREQLIERVRNSVAERGAGRRSRPSPARSAAAVRVGRLQRARDVHQNQAGAGRCAAPDFLSRDSSQRVSDDRRAPVARRLHRRSARVVVEKPFGRDLESARALNATLHQRVFRGRDLPHRSLPRQGSGAEHPVLPVRQCVSRADLESASTSRACTSRWPSRSASKGAARFYEETGVIRDVVQNHLLQIVGYLAMEPPSSAWREALRDEQAKVLRTVRPLAPAEIVLGQFRGYRDEAGVEQELERADLCRAGSLRRFVAMAGRAVSCHGRQVPERHAHRCAREAEACAGRRLSRAGVA